jgi:hypothetical protein
VVKVVSVVLGFENTCANTHTDISAISMKEAASFFMVREEEGKVLGFVNGNFCLCVFCM